MLKDLTRGAAHLLSQFIEAFCHRQKAFLYLCNPVITDKQGGLMLCKQLALLYQCLAYHRKLIQPDLLLRLCHPAFGTRREQGAAAQTDITQFQKAVIIDGGGNRLGKADAVEFCRNVPTFIKDAFIKKVSKALRSIVT